MTEHEAWKAHQEDVFDVVADLDKPSDRIQYAFRAGYRLARGESIPAQSSEICAPCKAGDHAMCHFWARHRWWEPCGCLHGAHAGLMVPVDPHHPGAGGTEVSGE